MLCLRDLPAQHPHGQSGADGRKMTEMQVRIGLKRAGQGSAGAIQPLPRDRKQFDCGGQRARRGAQLVAAAFLAALPAQHRASRQAFDLEGARGRSALARIVVYPGAYHDFDRSNLPLHAIVAAADAAAPERGHLGTDPEARADSQKRVAEWLAR